VVTLLKHLFVFLIFFVFSTIVEAKEKKKPSEAPVKSEVLQQKSTTLDLKDLGLPESAQQGNQANQELLNKRSSMLQIHQILGLVTLGLMTATYFTAREEQEATELHEILGYSTAASYAATAYFSLTAPELEEGLSEKGWGMKIHKTLMFVHLPGMILTPIAGYLANKAYKEGKKPSGLAEYKATIANVTYFSFATAALSVTFNF
jgi:cytochrome b561